MAKPFAQFWFSLQSNQTLSVQFLRIAESLGLEPFVLLAYLSQRPQSLGRFEIYQKMVELFSANFDVDAVVAPEVALIPMLRELNLASFSLGLDWTLVKLPRSRDDALVLAAVLPDQKKVALKVHVAAYGNVYMNYMTLPLRERINELGKLCITLQLACL